MAILLILSAFFSGSEVAIFSLDKKKLREVKDQQGLTGQYIFKLLEFPRRLLVTILLGNTFVNVGASIISVTLALSIANKFGYPTDIVLIIQIVLLTIMILLFAEITPKVWASKYPLRFSRFVSVPLYWVSVLIYPIAKILTDIIKFFVSKLKVDKGKTAILTSELADLADIGIEKGTIEEDEHELIHSLVSFKTVTAREIMTPRVDMTSVPIETDFKELMTIIQDSGHSRIPLFENNLDNILGIIYAKDLLPYLSINKSPEQIDLRKIARDPLFVPESKLISDLMHEFQEKNMHMGIVVDEYGGTSGLVSLEDIIEEIVGEIRDEYDREEVEITKISDTSYMVLGKLPIDELNEHLDSDFSSEDDDYDTVGGFIFNMAGKIPEEGFSLVYNNYRFTVKEIENKRMNKVLIENLQQNSTKE